MPDVGDQMSVKTHALLTPDIWNLISDYVKLLLEWNKRINLIGRSTEEKIWHRHILDSVQLTKYLTDTNARIVDLGSGAGLPGAVLALCGYRNVTLVEKNAKKATFLRNVSRETSIPFQVIEKDIKDVQDKYDVVISRGLTDLSTLLELSYPLLVQGGQCLFLKGERIDDEIIRAISNWKMTMTKKESITNPRASLLLIANLERAQEKNEESS
jgi:16S rRNA (guanine527-N7)-methyltransferase